MKLLNLTPKGKLYFSCAIIALGIFGVALCEVDLSLRNIAIILSAVFILNGMKLLFVSIKELIQLKLKARLWSDNFTKK